MPRTRGWESGLWSAEIPDHALGRLLQRDPVADLTACLLDLHRNALAMRIAQLGPYNTFREHRAFLLKAGSGAAATRLWASDEGADRVYLRVETWLSWDAIFRARFQHRAPTIGAVHVARPQGASFQIAELNEHEQRVITRARVNGRNFAGSAKPVGKHVMGTATPAASPLLRTMCGCTSAADR